MTDGTFTCSSCGHPAGRWFGRCPRCGEWGTAAAAAPPPKGRARGTGPGASPSITSLAQTGEAERRLSTGCAETDRVLGGGLVPGSVVLFAGEPGIGKSTLLLRMMDGLAARGATPLLASGEESVAQVAARASRLGIDGNRLPVAASTEVPSLIAACREREPSVLFVDSIQTLRSPEHTSAPGSVVQVRESASALVDHAKATGTVVVLVGHVTKEGTVAGPKTLEHLVDAVVSLDGERSGTFRLLRAIKNRFGSCDETGVFEMTPTGLRAVEDPSSMFLADRDEHAAGSVVLPTLEGTRPLLVEVQALQASSEIGRRVALGFDPRRLSLLLAVVEQNTGRGPGKDDVFVAIAGGLQVADPAADLAVCLALRSAALRTPVDPRTIAIGEVGLGGEIRRTQGVERRLSEAARLGFRRALVPATCAVDGPLETIEVRHLRDAFAVAGLRSPRRSEAAA